MTQREWDEERDEGVLAELAADEEALHAEADPPEDEPSKVEELNDLQALLQKATAQSVEEKRLKAARKRLVQIQRYNHPDQAQEQLALLSEINTLEEKRVWHTVGCIALFYKQVCGTCQTTHEFFMGWFTVRTHATDKHLRDLKAGEPNEPLPRWAEVMDRGIVPVCAKCCELRIAAEVAMGVYPGIDA
jgi:hypothetical protein